jgi:hypothetical protein
MDGQVGQEAVNAERGAVPWVIAAVAAGIALVLAVGLLRGELVVPAKGFMTTIQHATNPVAFYATAGFYAAMAGLCVWLLVAVLRASDGAPTSAAGAVRASVFAGGRFPGKIGYAQSGREGAVVVELATGRHDFYWEFGGGDCVAIVSVPNERHWAKLPVLAPHPRDQFIAALAREVGAAQCPSARIEITADAILFRQ